jgi:hypothetical protein
MTTPNPTPSPERPSSFARTTGSVRAGKCSWHEPRHCQCPATHYHHAYGTVCGYHAKEIELKHPEQLEKCKVLRGGLLPKLFPPNTFVRDGGPDATNLKPQG